MTTSEFNEKYKDYLVTGHYGLDISVPTVIEFLDKIFQDLIKIPHFKYTQIKLKFDSCRFYTNLHGTIPFVSILLENKIEERINQLVQIDMQVRQQLKRIQNETKNNKDQ